MDIVLSTPIAVPTALIIVRTPPCEFSNKENCHPQTWEGVHPY